MANFDDVLRHEYNLYLKRYCAYLDSNMTDEVAELMTSESERILRQFYFLKHGINPDDDISQWLLFWENLSKL